MTTYTIEQKTRKRWVSILRHWGEQRESWRGTYQAWCVLKDGKFLCEAASKKAAEFIVAGLSSAEQSK